MQWIAQLHVDILKIFEECPESLAKLRDMSIMFPVYNYTRLQIKGDSFDQYNVHSLEVELVQNLLPIINFLKTSPASDKVGAVQRLCYEESPS